MPLRYKRRLLAHLAHKSYTPATIETLIQDLGIEDHGEFKSAIDTLAGEGVVEVTDRGHIRLPSLGSLKGEVIGTFSKNPRGFGFVEPEGAVREGDIFIPPGEGMDALSGDTVRVALERDRRRERDGDGPQFTGRVLEVLKRKRGNYTGTIDRRGSQWLVYPDGKQMTDPIVVRDATSKNAKVGDKVVVEMVVYPENGALGEGVIVKVLGEAGRPDVETQAVIAAFNLPAGEFPSDCLRQARDINSAFEAAISKYQKIGPEALPGRRDLTGDFIITIDPPDAKDYDDAISIVRTADGWDLGVHIADVGEFIAPGTPLDAEARERGNSVYLPRLVIPMLPELLSNGICSLQEAVHRFTKSAFMSYGRDGSIRREGVASTIIRSAKRLTYLEAQALIDGDQTEAKKHAKTEPNYTPQLLSTLQEMNSCAKAIQERRRKNGMISLELPDVNLIFDEEGRVIDAEKEDDAYTHTLIEMFMVEANEVLARLFERLDVPLIRRTHPEPVPGNVDEMRKAAKVAGFVIPKSPSREELQGLLDATRGTPAARAVHMAVLRTLTKAEYSPALIGHFALASAAYAHFTSPIRRYADLTVHRAMVEYLKHTDNGQKRPQSDPERKALGAKLRDSKMCPPFDELMTISRHITQTEVNAESAERELRQFLVLQLLEKHIGESFAGVITGVTPRGVFVQIDKYLADGMVKAEDLPGDTTRSSAPPQWKIDPRTGALVDQRSGRSFNMGDTVTIRIAAVDLSRRQMDLVIDDAASRAVGKSKLPKLALGGAGGGIDKGHGAGFKERTGSQKRSQRSRSRDQRKTEHRRDHKK
jgi:ribonuclease R